MTLIMCSQCGKQYEEDEFACPHCGTAQIPQLSKAELRMQNLKASSGPYGYSLAGTGIGLLLGVAILVIALLNDAVTMRNGIQYGAGVLIGGMLGGAAGIVVHYYFVDRN